MEQNNNISLVENKTKYKLFIPDAVEHKIREWCRLSPNNEWSGTLFYDVIGSFENNDIEFTAKDFYVLDIGTSGFTRYKVTPEICNYMMEHDLLDCKTGLLHSHQSMSAFFSGTDSDTLKKEGLDSCHYLSLVVCNSGPYVARVTRHIKEAFEGTKITKYSSYGDSEISFSDEVSIIERDCIEYFNLDIEIESRYKDINEEVLSRYTELKKSSSSYGNQTSPQFNGYGANYWRSQWLNDDNDDNDVWKQPAKPLGVAQPVQPVNSASPIYIPSVYYREPIEKKEEEKKKEEGRKEEKEKPVLKAEDNSIHISKDQAISYAAQMLYGNVTLSYESFKKFEHVNDWINKNMKYVFDKRFKNQDDFNNWMYDHCFNIVSTAASELSLGHDDLAIDELRSSVASDIIDAIYDICDCELKEITNPYVLEILMNLNEFVNY